MYLSACRETRLWNTDNDPWRDRTTISTSSIEAPGLCADQLRSPLTRPMRDERKRSWVLQVTSKATSAGVPAEDLCPSVVMGFGRVRPSNRGTQILTFVQRPTSWSPCRAPRTLSITTHPRRINNHRKGTARALWEHRQRPSPWHIGRPPVDVGWPGQAASLPEEEGNCCRRHSAKHRQASVRVKMPASRSSLTTSAAPSRCSAICCSTRSRGADRSTT